MLFLGLFFGLFLQGIVAKMNRERQRALLMVWCLLGYTGLICHSQVDIIIPISQGGTYEIDCESVDTYIFTDDNGGLGDPKNLTLTLTTRSPSVRVPRVMPFL